MSYDLEVKQKMQEIEDKIKNLLIINFPKNRNLIIEALRFLGDSYYESKEIHLDRLIENCYGIYFNPNYKEYLGAFKNTDISYYLGRFKLKEIDFMDFYNNYVCNKSTLKQTQKTLF